eukprot:gnl/Hemi2/7375_TR2515_c0_g1_i1.p1 gnl/Hemi2/7375_TR2515_c0_g1~~gnl/Hemi2/7375_TR2515_c0_g1_i1.p1  ORF type:complete len:306 (+),score=57.85 gnl/Hemi2/7375_TR2515_c0_g1_i1:3-920(+)
MVLESFDFTLVQYPSAAAWCEHAGNATLGSAASAGADSVTQLCLAVGSGLAGLARLGGGVLGLGGDGGAVGLWAACSCVDQALLLLVLLSLLPQALCVAYATAFYQRRDVATLALILGQALNEVLNAVLKRVLRIPRPSPQMGAGFGMPSSHAQFMGFLVCHILLSLLPLPLAPAPPAKPTARLHVDSNTDAAPCRCQWTWAWAWRTALETLCIAGVCYSRVHLGYHSSAQVVAGVSLGLVFGVAWFALIALLRSRVYPVLLTSRLGTLLQLCYMPADLPGHSTCSAARDRRHTLRRLEMKTNTD